ncbi:MAG: protease SohB [Ectothiorhodospiraceae bacterium]|nr:protease SohB [Ectothiorhodospiraceae bacterium]
MLGLLADYGLFVAKLVTVLALLVVAAVAVAGAARREREGTEHLEVRRLGERYDRMQRQIRNATLSRRELRRAARQDRRERKAHGAETPRRRVFVLSFKGDLRASAVAALREEVSAVLASAQDGDEVLLRLENGGGTVHEHGLAASQLLRLKRRGIRLTVAVDKIAASGGYMMACVADHVVAAPFAVLGSIGVLLQLPNFNRLLDANGVDFEQIKGGEYKRTLTLFGRNTEEERERARDHVTQIHGLFKDFVHEHRPRLVLDEVATGEHWYGRQALELGLCDALGTSDDYLLEARADAELLELRWVARGGLVERIGGALSGAVDRARSALHGRAQPGEPLI